ncbi:transcriptional regulator AhrC/ArgR [Salinicoccus roseus]|jgi:transcriptional regulator of arginine metabolism|uniref:Arginine repressor n=1 Tax=Salinicoccus roseus TaxID=45670 RepID=A0A0C2E9H8_9STAP|nr:transcriptional regulator ArgR [Salinicoccus roseus]KIH71907.1 arginine repressor [Salinicoccus roseus]MBY8908614.1 transcriptional regulator ArgR [Salinicoccus roseus]MCG7333067.1 transcriptional regulator ArgR [Salinicoccus roseus]MDB0579046.1 transcriptional regulator ArgR [Salinicoccus roseus]OZT78080.1 arginine repressor [Salinicoccus roseus]
MSNKSIRQIKIREIITNSKVETQEDLVERLNEYNFNVTQATVSRDIKELQLIKVPTPSGAYIYSMPKDRKFHPLEKLGRYLMDSFVKLDYTENLLVLKTLPGNAQSIGAIIDQLEWEEVVGTICGDDTCLMICRNEEAQKEIRDRIFNLI